MYDIARTFFALWYVFGWIVHVILGTKAPETYRPFGRTALVAPMRRLWQKVVMPHTRVFALLLAAFEVVTGGLSLSKGVWVRIGLLGSIAFNLFLVVLGLGSPASSAQRDFLSNRLPNLLFAVAQIPLLWFRCDHLILSAIGGRLGLAEEVAAVRPRRYGIR